MKLRTRNIRAVRLSVTSVWKTYSKFSLLNKIYDAKKNYYSSGLTKLTDDEYDAVERSLTNIHGEATIKEWGCVGYDELKHNQIKHELLKADIATLEYCQDLGMITPELVDKRRELEIVKDV